MTNQVAHHKITPAKILLILVDDATEQHRMLGQLLIVRRQLGDHLLHHGQRGPAAQFKNNVPIGAGNCKGVANRAAALRHHGAQHEIAGQRHAHRAMVHNFVIDKEPAFAGLPAPAR